MRERASFIQRSGHNFRFSIDHLGIRCCRMSTRSPYWRVPLSEREGYDPSSDKRERGPPRRGNDIDERTDERISNLFVSSDPVHNLIPDQQPPPVLGPPAVSDDTPLLIRTPTGHLAIRTIDALSTSPWTPTPDSEHNLETQELNLEVYSDKGFTPITRLYRYQTRYPLTRFWTHSSIVDMTENHLFLLKNGLEATPLDGKLGNLAAHPLLPPVPSPQPPPEPATPIEFPPKMTPEIAWLMGIFYTEGHVGVSRRDTRRTNVWSIDYEDGELLQLLYRIITDLEPDVQFEIQDKMKHPYKVGKEIFTLHAVGSRRRGSPLDDMCKRWRGWFYDSRVYRIVPEFILTAPYDIRLSFLKGFHRRSGDGRHGGLEKIKGLHWSNHGKIGTAQLFYLFNSLGYSISMHR
ncbi:hypothetical protein HK097_003304, partial [Rhizophlyctis rosea]